MHTTLATFRPVPPRSASNVRRTDIDGQHRDSPLILDPRHSPTDNRNSTFDFRPSTLDSQPPTPRLPTPRLPDPQTPRLPRRHPRATNILVPSNSLIRVQSVCFTNRKSERWV